VVWVSDRIVALICDRAEQFGGCGEYWMRMMRVDYFHVWSSEVVAPPVSIKDRFSGPGEQL
jgi:hypothetical protein